MKVFGRRKLVTVERATQVPATRIPHSSAWIVRQFRQHFALGAEPALRMAPVRSFTLPQRGR